MNDSSKVNSNRHAYLIICHNNFNHLFKLIKALDDGRNDIYIHVDKKTKYCPFEHISKSAQKARLFLVKRHSVNWGGDSQIWVEMLLLKEATKTFHDYYHLISGMDFPIKSQNFIHDFFKSNKGKEYIQFDPDVVRKSEFCDRVRYYYFFQNLIGHNKGKIPALCYNLQELSLSIQKKTHIDRTKRLPFKIYKGTNWFSITHNLALFLIQNQKAIKHLCRFSLCADELFLQTFSMISPFRNNIVDDSLRYIDWERGKPYTFTEADYNELVNANKLFARKFDENISKKVVDRILNSVNNF